MSEPVIICQPTITHISAVLPLWVRVSPWIRKHSDFCNTNIDTNAPLLIYVNRGSSLTSIFGWVLRRWQMTDSRHLAESKTLQAMCVCVPHPLFTAASSFFCHSKCHVSLSSGSIFLNTCRILRHTCRSSFPGGPQAGVRNCDDHLEIIHTAHG